MNRSWTISKTETLYFSAFSIVVIGCFILPPIIEMILCLAFIVYAAVYDNTLIAKKRVFSAIIFLFPIILSCIQNIYLGLAVNRLSSMELQVLLTMNILIAFFASFFHVIATGKIRECSWCLICIAFTIIYSLIGLFFKKPPVTSFLSSLRNIIAPFIFFYYAYVFGKKINRTKVRNIYIKIIAFVVMFGFVEYLSGGRIWNIFNVADLWNLKGITIGLKPGEYPPNWYASETILGRIHLQRMVSCFADPVNLGSFLFAAFTITWYYKKRILMGLIVLCCILTISKGALLGFLIFAVVYLWYKDKSRMLAFASCGLGLCVGLYVLFVGRNASAGLHFMMFVRSLSIPLRQPLGMGVGTLGVIAGVTSGYQVSEAVVETGIGVVIAQLGVVGVLLYIILFAKMIKIPRVKYKGDKRAKILLYTLIISFFANAMFNEVALSPNSCGIYFIELGLFDVLASPKLNVFKNIME